MRDEVIRQARRLRTRIALAVMVAIPLLILAAIEIGGVPRPQPGEAHSFGDLANQSGISFALFALTLSSNFLLIVVVALFAGDSISSEAGWGTLRYLLAMPIARGRLLRTKLLVAIGYGITAVVLLPTAALVMGTIVYGWHHVQTPTGAIIAPTHAALLLYEATGYLMAALLLVAALAFLLSTITDAPLGAVGATVLIMVTSQILNEITSLGRLRNVLPTHYITAWTALFSDPVDPTNMAWGILASVAWTTTLLCAAWWWFHHKDITS